MTIKTGLSYRRFHGISRNAAFAFGLVAICGSTATNAFAQRRAVPPKPAIFAVLKDGVMLEPIAYVNRGKLEAPVNGSDAPNLITAFNRNYYKAGTKYRLIFGGANSGTVTVKSSDAKSDCSKNMAQVTTQAAKTPLKGLVMGLATNAPTKSKASAYRRMPTPTERVNVEELVKAEFTRQKLSPTNLRYHNLTALDLDNDNVPDFVGTFWVEIDRLTRGLLFVIAEKGKDGKYTLSHKEYRSIDQANVMSGDITHVDEGVYHELLLDVFDYNDDGVREVFTYIQSFEGSGFKVYKRSGGKWLLDFEGSNYHCAF